MARRRRRRGGGGEALKVALGIVLALAAFGALGAIFWLRETAARPPALDAETLCPLDGPRAVTVVLLDGSDALPDAGQRQVTTALLDLAETLPDHGLLELRLLDPADPGGRLLFHRCNPGTGAGLSEWTANPKPRASAGSPPSASRSAPCSPAACRSSSPRPRRSWPRSSASRSTASTATPSRACRRRSWWFPT